MSSALGRRADNRRIANSRNRRSAFPAPRVANGSVDSRCGATLFLSNQYPRRRNVRSAGMPAEFGENGPQTASRVAPFDSKTYALIRSATDSPLRPWRSARAQACPTSARRDSVHHFEITSKFFVALSNKLLSTFVQSAIPCAFRKGNAAAPFAP